MKWKFCIRFGFLLLACGVIKSSAIEHFVSLDGGHISPFTSWADAATNIQAAIDAASAGDTVWATNGVYSTGGKVMAGDLTNRVVLDKALTVRSVNGPFVTTIQGTWDQTSTNGPGAMRCAWLTNAATLSGFTLLGGATRTLGDVGSLLGGGGVLCSSSNAVVHNCRITGNAAMYGGGAYGGTLVNCQIEYNTAVTDGGGAYSVSIGGVNSCVLISCEIVGNEAVHGGGSAFATLLQCKVQNNRAEYGGGAYAGSVSNCEVLGNSASTNGGGLHGYSPGTFTVKNSRIAGNFAKVDGGGVYAANSGQGFLNNCTITGNTAGANGGGTFQGTLRNCIIYFNTVNAAGGLTDTYQTTSSAIQYCCMSESRAGTGNITSYPLFLADGWHLSTNSPCRSAGSAASATGTDFDGQGWANPPSMGCDQWLAPPAVSKPAITPAARAAGRIAITGVAAGQEPFAYRWLKDGIPLEDGLIFSGSSTAQLTLPVTDSVVGGGFQLVVTNSFGAITSQLTKVSLRFVDVNGPNPTPPYSTWATAATNIQNAIDVALTGEVVVVANGIYATGGRVFEGLTNRVMLYKPVTIQSVNGPSVTTIQGAWHPTTTNGASAVRCAWLADGAGLGGFTLRGGATLNDPASVDRVVGGGLRCISTNAVVANCWITGNAAYDSGGGAYLGSLINCVLTGNSAISDGGGACRASLTQSRLLQNSAGRYGGGAYQGTLQGCALRENYAGLNGGGTRDSILSNCSVANNAGRSSGAGVYGGTLRNCIVVFNTRFVGTIGTSDNISSASSAQYTCSSPLPAGVGNLNVDPGFMADGLHISSNSPCRSAGSMTFVGGSDFDGQPWASPPSIGCDEWQPAPVVVVQPTPRPAIITGQVKLSAVAAGQPPFQFSWSKDGLPLADSTHYTNAQSESLLIRDFGVGDAGAYQVVASNALGVVTSQVVQVTVHCVDAASAAPTTPYTTWGTAATTIQDAVDVAGTADVVLVTNGVYANGGRTKSGALTNRVVVDRPMLITSVNGPEHTVIQGQWDPVSTNGPAAVRCAWLGDGAALSGFTLRKGATLQTGIGFDGTGGGALCSSTNSELVNCVITNSCAFASGGGVQNGLLRNCELIGNSVVHDAGFPSGGGGADDCTLVNCILMRNTSWKRGGGASDSWLYNCAVTENASGGSGGGVNGNSLINCTVAANTAATSGGGVSGAYLTNCIVYLNSAPTSPNVVFPVISQSTCFTPLLAGAGNISSDPQLTDGWHLSVNSPCRGMGLSSAATGTDLDGDPWASPPSMGCDEVANVALVGPLSVTLTAAYPEVAAYGSLPLLGKVSGRATTVEWSFGEGASFTNLSSLTYHTWTNPGDYLVTFTTYNNDNPGGVSTNRMVHVVPLVEPQLSASGLSGTSFTLSFPGQAGITYVVEQSTNLATPIYWQALQTLISTGAVIQVTDTKATNTMRFYRTRMQ